MQSCPSEADWIPLPQHRTLYHTLLGILRTSTRNKHEMQKYLTHSTDGQTDEGAPAIVGRVAYGPPFIAVATYELCGLSEDLRQPVCIFYGH